MLRPAVTKLLGGNPTAADIGWVDGILSMIVGDYFGRVRTLMLSVVLVAVCMALQGLHP
jgi:hypothetical protein